MHLEDELGDILQKARDGKAWSREDLVHAADIAAFGDEYNNDEKRKKKLPHPRIHIKDQSLKLLTIIWIIFLNMVQTII